MLTSIEAGLSATGRRDWTGAAEDTNEVRRNLAPIDAEGPISNHALSESNSSTGS
ncbi:MAG: hypothetical protein QOJ61_4138 [Mycobacterium sp.]|nr:hypothetical protein [Mycobacterium sp.]